MTNEALFPVAVADLVASETQDIPPMPVQYVIMACRGSYWGMPTRRSMGERTWSALADAEAIATKLLQNGCQAVKIFRLSEKGATDGHSTERPE